MGGARSIYLHALAGQLVNTDGNGLVESVACCFDHTTN